jgi:hypothetical protein
LIVVFLDTADELSVVCTSNVLSLAVTSFVVDKLSSVDGLLLKSNTSTVVVDTSVGTDDDVIVDV